jgi:hypothetical protein
LQSLAFGLPVAVPGGRLVDGLLILALWLAFGGGALLAQIKWLPERPWQRAMALVARLASWSPLAFLLPVGWGPGTQVFWLFTIRCVWVADHYGDEEGKQTDEPCTVIDLVLGTLPALVWLAALDSSLIAVLQSYASWLPVASLLGLGLLINRVRDWALPRVHAWHRPVDDREEARKTAASRCAHCTSSTQCVANTSIPHPASCSAGSDPSS